jgi:hypothetical protein
MSYKFSVGQAVEYTPIGEKTAGLYKILRQMPNEDQATDFRYLIKSEAEAYERIAPEAMLGSEVGAESEYAAPITPHKPNIEIEVTRQVG